MKLVTLTACTLMFAVAVAAQEAKRHQPGCSMHAGHSAGAKKGPDGRSRASADSGHGHEVDARHDSFGMSHRFSKHSFRLFPDGGAIELRANDASDASTVASIRKHLEEIRTQFQAGDFSTPRFVHGYDPDGVEDLERRGKEISWLYESLESGGRIRITTKTPEARAAIHAFLRFQVVEHRTGDSGKVEASR